MFEILIDDIAQRFGLGTDAAQGLFACLLGLLFDPRNDGIAGVAGRFRQQGLDLLFASWLGSGAIAQAISPQQLDDIFGASALSSIANRFGVGRNTIAAAASAMLPQIVGELTPNGELPAAIPDSIKGYLTGLPGFGNLAGIGGALGNAAGSVEFTVLH